MSTHTTGPWLLKQNRITADLKDSRGQYVAETIRFREPNAESNARLIAAAPDLLEACKAVRDSAITDSDHCAICLQEPSKHSSGCSMLLIEAAIEKATRQSGG